MRTSRPARVVVFVEQLICAETLAGALEEPTAIVVATTTNRDALAEIVERRRPDLCLVDIPVPDAECLVAISEIIRRTPDTKVVALVGDVPAGFVDEALDAGVRGFARKDGTLRALRNTIERVAAGEARVGAETVLPTRFRPPVGLPRHGSGPTGCKLTHREYEVLDRMIAGQETRHIAAALRISRSTARTHVQNVRLKLGARTRLQAVAYAVGTGRHPSQPTGQPIAG
jgi:two-component system, NarL family, nitrate/nitrite response regulator NarL